MLYKFDYCDVKTFYFAIHVGIGGGGGKESTPQAPLRLLSGPGLKYG